MIKSDLITLFLLDVSRLIHFIVKFSTLHNIKYRITLHFPHHITNTHRQMSRNVTLSILCDGARPLSHYMIPNTEFWNKLRLRGRPANKLRPCQISYKLGLQYFGRVKSVEVPMEISS